MIYEIKIYDEKNPNEYSLLITDKFLSVFKFLEEVPGLIVAKQLNKIKE